MASKLQGPTFQRALDNAGAHSETPELALHVAEAADSFQRIDGGACFEARPIGTWEPLPQPWVSESTVDMKQRLLATEVKQGQLASLVNVLQRELEKIKEQLPSMQQQWELQQNELKERAVANAARRTPLHELCVQHHQSDADDEVHAREGA